MTEREARAGASLVDKSTACAPPPCGLLLARPYGAAVSAVNDMWLPKVRTGSLQSIGKEWLSLRVRLPYSPPSACGVSIPSRRYAVVTKWSGWTSMIESCTGDATNGGSQSSVPDLAQVDVAPTISRCAQGRHNRRLSIKRSTIAPAGYTGDRVVVPTPCISREDGMASRRQFPCMSLNPAQTAGPSRTSIRPVAQ